jgi:ribosome-binding protein aMBF1 (putative translation factor)
MGTSIAARLDSLKVQRVAAGLSVTDLARKSNTSDQVINTLENVGTNGKGGTCTHEVADRICAALGISRVTAGFVDHHG